MPQNSPVDFEPPKSVTGVARGRKPLWCVTLLGLAAIGLVSCATVPDEETTDSTPISDEPDTASNATRGGGAVAAVTLSPEAYAVADLVSMLRQVLDPVHTTIQVGVAEQSDDAEIVLRELSESGYGIQLVDADQGAHYLSHEKTVDAESSDGTNFEFLIRIGGIEMMRSYTKIGREDIRPISPMQIAGTRTRVNLDDRRFGPTVAEDPLVSRVDYIGSQLDLNEVPVISLLKDPLTGQDPALTGGPTLIALNSSKVEINNRFYGASAFNSITDDYERIDRRTVVFSNDSMRLGRSGKQVISVFLNEYLEKSDLIGLIGCSNGTTALEIGNEGLALGRASRITKELISLGVPRDKILDEGCWAPTVAEEFPARGVVIELWRKGA